MDFSNIRDGKTICAIATAPGVGGIAVIRVSGDDAFKIVQQFVKKDLEAVESHHSFFAPFRVQGTLLDETVMTLFKGGKSFTGENCVEIACHGSSYIQQEIIKVLIAGGCRMAMAGEFTLRAYVNGKMDLSQAEAVADLVHSEGKAMHEMAMKQMRGGFSQEINHLREQLINFASLIELELDFSQEDVEFADRTQFKNLLTEVKNLLKSLIDSFALGNVIKNGIPIAIVGAPNAGKSTLLNALLKEERAIVSDIEGTTRDTVEESMNIEGYTFRFIDTAGIRSTADTIEKMGIERSYQKAQDAAYVLYLVDSSKADKDSIKKELEHLKTQVNIAPEKLILVLNKVDLKVIEMETQVQQIAISAKQKEGIEKLKELLLSGVKAAGDGSHNIIVSNARHHEALQNAYDSIMDIENGMEMDIPSDLIAMDIRQALHHLGSITGAISVDDLLGNIFSKFCIGK